MSIGTSIDNAEKQLSLLRKNIKKRGKFVGRGMDRREKRA